MGVISTFGTYALARLGIYSAQTAISVTGNNISNVNTKGYTRQGLDQISMNSGGADRYQSMFNVRIGNGSLVRSVTQLRDQYLDLRYRDAQADVGSVDATLAIQQQIAAILDEVGAGADESGVLEAYFSAMEEELQNMITQGVGDDRYETLFRSAASTVARQLRDYAAQLKDLEEKTQEQFQMDVDRVNEILTNIRELNVQIRKSQIFGADPLELQDARNVLIDELSYYLDIRVSIEQENIGNDEYVDRLVISTVSADGSDGKDLIYGIYGAQLSVMNTDKYDGTFALAVSKLKDINGLTYSNTTTEKKTLSLDDIAKLVGPLTPAVSGSTDPERYSMTYDENGYHIFYGEQANPVFEADLDWLKAALETVGYKGSTDIGDTKTTTTSYAFAQNDDGTITVTTTTTTKSTGYVFGDTELYGALQSEREMLTESGNFWLTLDDTDPETPSAYLKADPNGDTKRGIPYYQKMLDLFANSFATMMNEANEKAGGGALFSNNGAGDDWKDPPIDASNISISKSWANRTVYVVHGESDSDLSTDSTNLLRILGILKSEDLKFTLTTAEGNEETIFTGSFQQLFTNHTVGNLATDISTNNTRLDNYENVMEEIYVERDGVSGVYLDDEAMNMMQYQQAYNAACRLMTTYDEMIDKLVNGT